MSYIWDIPTKVLFGPGMLKTLGNEKLPGVKALLVISNGKSVRENGSLDETLSQLSRCGAECVLYDKIEANPTVDVVDEGVAAARENRCDFVVGLGGGSVLDSATVIAAMAPQKVGTTWDYVRRGTGGKKALECPSLPHVAIATSAGTGSEVDRIGVVTNPKTKEKIGFLGAFPTLAVVDPELMLTVPASFTAFQGFDALFHSVEGYISNRRNEAADMVELTAVRAIGKYLPIAVHDGGNLEARTQVAFASNLGGYSMDLSTCTSEHAIEHALSGHHPELPHGAGLIMVSLAYYQHHVDAHACDGRFIDLARALGASDADKPEDFIAALRNLQNECGVAELRMSDYGIEEEEFSTFAQDARYTLPHLFEADPAPLTDDDVIDIYRRSFR